MSSAVPVEMLRDVEGAIETAKFSLGLRCARCEAEGYSRSCPNCSGVSRDANDNRKVTTP